MQKMNFMRRFNNYTERGISLFLNCIPLKYHSQWPVGFFIRKLLRGHWRVFVNNPDSPNNYKNYYRDTKGEFRPILDKLENRLGRRPMSFLEVGSNVGSNLMAIAEIYNFEKGIEYAGIDLNELAMREARKNHYGGKASFVVGDITNMNFLRGFSNDTFDVIFSRHVFTSIEPGKIKQKIIKELLRICRHSLVLVEPWYKKDRVVYVNSHLVYYEDMNKYMPKDGYLIESMTIPDYHILIAYKNIQNR